MRRSGNLGKSMEREVVVVVVEDDPDILDLLKEIFAGDGYVVVGLTSPNVPAIMQGCHKPNVFLIDLMLPGISGVDLASALRPHFPGIPMLAMSASRFMLEMAGASGLFREAIAKPFDLSVLVDTVDRCLQAPGAGDRRAVHTTSY